MLIYIAAPYSSRDKEAFMAMNAVRERGHIVTSRWIYAAQEPKSNEQANIDLDDVKAADVLLTLNLPGWEEKGSGGRHVEFGYALALGKSIVHVGRRSSVFHYLDQIIVVDTLEEALAWLTSLAPNAAP